MKIINPFNEEIMNEFVAINNAQINEIIDQSFTDFLIWQQKSQAIRCQLLKNISIIVKKNEQKYAELITQEMGKILPEAIAELQKCQALCDYYAENAEYFLQSEFIKNSDNNAAITYQPLGIIFAIMPWNFPFWQVLRFAIPAIAAGNTVILKHAPNVLGCANILENLFSEAGDLQNLFRNIIIEHQQVEYIIKHRHIQAVTFTGSTATGRIIAGFAGKYLKKTVLELGGNDPYIILKDADLSLAIEKTTQGRMLNAGQSCIAAKRLIIEADIYDEMLNLLLEKYSNIKFGDPLSPATNIGPIARSDLRDKLHQQVVKSIEKGAKCLLGGYIPDMQGYFYPATILADIDENMPAYNEELFGPVISVIKAKNSDDAVRIANDSIYGLGAGIFTKNLDLAANIMQKLECGTCCVNNVVRSDMTLPFGGIKDSGYGRELSSFGIKEFTNIKTIKYDNETGK
ncbi:MAG: NAD-dependent succinate-semialdehyde dehydrogenase [Pseudomonadota bacterium]